MLHLFYYLRVNKLVRVMRTPWVRIGTALCLLIFVTPLVLQQCESTDSAYARYFDGVYFTFVTMSTVGYGDISPTSDAGKIIVIFLIVCGCAMYAVIIGEGASLIWQRGEAKLKGKISHSMEGHIVLMEEGSLTVARDCSKRFSPMVLTILKTSCMYPPTTKIRSTRRASDTPAVNRYTKMMY